MDWMQKIEKIEKALGIYEQRGELARLLGINSRIISDIKSGRSKNPSSTIALLLINKLNVNPEWLESGKGSIFNKQETLPIEASNDTHLSKKPCLDGAMKEFIVNNVDTALNNVVNISKQHQDKHTSMLTEQKTFRENSIQVSSENPEKQEPIADYASAIEELLKPLIIKIHGKELPPSQKALDTIDELAQLLAEPPAENAPKLDKKTEAKLDAMIIEMANMKRDLAKLMEKQILKEEI